MPRITVKGHADADKTKLAEWDGVLSTYDICNRCESEVEDGYRVQYIDIDFGACLTGAGHEPQDIELALDLTHCEHPPYENGEYECEFCMGRLRAIDD